MVGWPIGPGRSTGSCFRNTYHKSPADHSLSRRQRNGAPDGRELDWRATALGPTYGWTHSLRTAVRILLTSRHAMWMGWGPDLAFLYNDAYKPTLGVKHPAALGWPAQQVWSEIWHDISPRIQTVMKTGTATWDEGLLLVLERSGYPEETYHTFSYSPLTEEDGTVSGMLCGPSPPDWAMTWVICCCLWMYG